MKRIGLIFGTRPEGIKIAPLYHELNKRNIEVVVINTGQHDEMLNQVLDLFDIKSNYNLKIMKKGQSLSELTSRLVIKLEEVLKQEKLDGIIVQGDTTSALAGALVGFYNNIQVFHVEAGLRTGDIYSPFPEEANRKMISILSKMNFAPTQTNKLNLLKENIEQNKIIITGNTVIDSLFYILNKYKLEIRKKQKKYGLLEKKYILMTLHRRENLGPAMERILNGTKKYLLENKDIFLVFPQHKNPLVREVVEKVLADVKNKILLEPLEYLDFISLLNGAHYIMTDSGGIQEEAPSLGKPVLILRDTTERPEAVKAGTSKLIGTEIDAIYRAMKLLETFEYEKMKKAINPYGDGNTARIIVDYLEAIK